MQPRIIEIGIDTAGGQTTYTLRVKAQDGTVLATASNTWASTTTLSTAAAWAKAQMAGYLGGLTVADLAGIGTANTDLLGVAALLMLSEP